MEEKKGEEKGSKDYLICHSSLVQKRPEFAYIVATVKEADEMAQRLTAPYLLTIVFTTPTSPTASSLRITHTEH